MFSENPGKPEKPETGRDVLEGQAYATMIENLDTQIDLFLTILQVAGIKPPPGKKSNGVSIMTSNYIT